MGYGKVDCFGCAVIGSTYSFKSVVFVNKIYDNGIWIFSKVQWIGNADSCTSVTKTRDVIVIHYYFEVINWTIFYQSLFSSLFKAEIFFYLNFHVRKLHLHLFQHRQGRDSHFYWWYNLRSSCFKLCSGSWGMA